MKTIFCIVPAIVGLTVIAAAQTPYAAYHPSTIGSGAYSEHFCDAFSFLTNTASLAGCAQLSSGIYAENRYMLPELANYSAVVSLPVLSGGLGVAMHYEGSAESYHTVQWGLAYGKKLGGVQVGARFNYTMVRIAGYGSDAAMWFEAGTVWQVTDQFFTGLQLSNPYGGRFGRSSAEKLPSAWTFGAGYECSEKLLLTATVTKEENKPVMVQAGLHYTVAERLVIQLGMVSAPATPCLTLGWQWENIRLLVTGSYHPQLGMTPGLALMFTGNKRTGAISRSDMKVNEFITKMYNP